MTFLSSYQFRKAISSCFKSMNFPKNGVACRQQVLKFSLSVGIYSANFQQILDFFTPNFRLKYENLEDIKTDRVNITIMFILRA